MLEPAWRKRLKNRVGRPLHKPNRKTSSWKRMILVSLIIFTFPQNIFPHKQILGLFMLLLVLNSHLATGLRGLIHGFLRHFCTNTQTCVRSFPFSPPALGRFRFYYLSALNIPLLSTFIFRVTFVYQRWHMNQEVLNRQFKKMWLVVFSKLTFMPIRTPFLTEIFSTVKFLTKFIF